MPTYPLGFYLNPLTNPWVEKLTQTHTLIEQKPTRFQVAGTHCHLYSCVSSVVLMGRETGSLHLLVPLLLTGGKGADLVIRGNVVLNTLSARSTLILPRDQIYIDSPSS
jgi:hypothetical protein